MIVALWIGGIIETRLLSAPTIDSSLRIVFSRISKTVLVMISVLIGMSLVGLDLTTLSVVVRWVSALGSGCRKSRVTTSRASSSQGDCPISIGNIIQVGQDRGEVTRITTRYTVLRASNGSNVLLPNEVLVASTVLNDSYVDPRWRVAVQVQIAYSSDVESALAILDELAHADPRILVEPAPKSNVLALEDSGIRLDLSFWVGNASHTSPDLRSDLSPPMLKRFKAAGIDIPYPQRKSGCLILLQLSALSMLERVRRAEARLAVFFSMTSRSANLHAGFSSGCLQSIARRSFFRAAFFMARTGRLFAKRQQFPSMELVHDFSGSGVNR